jgi:hypothetical protein
MLALGEGLTPLVPSAIFWKTSSRDATLREKICFFSKSLSRVQHSGKILIFLTLFPECNTRGRNSIFLKKNPLP